MITSLLSFRNYIKLMLGNPVVNVEVDDSQYDQIIEDSVQLFQRYSYGDGTYRDVLTINLSANVSAYQLDSSIDSILDITTPNFNSISDLFTPQHNLLYNSWINGSYPGGGGTGQTQGMGGAFNVSNYNVGMIYLKEIESMFVRKYTCEFSPNTYMLRVWPTPLADDIAMLTVWKKENVIPLYNHPLVKKLALGKCRVLWGLNLGKYAMNLPGGGTLNYQIHIDRGTKEEEEALAAIQAETHPPIFMVG